MTILDYSHYPAIRAAIDTSLDSEALPDDVISLPIYAGAADAEVETRDPLWATRQGDPLVQLTNAETLIVPAGGRVMTQAELIAERDMTQELYQRLNTLIRKGCSASCMQQEGALEGLGRTWADPQRFLYAAYKGLWAHHYNLAPDIL